MQHDPDQRFSITPLHDFCPLESTPCYRQREYSWYRRDNILQFETLLTMFRVFLSILQAWLVQISSQIYFVLHVDKEGHLRHLVRANIQGDNHDINKKWPFSASNSHVPWHPVEKYWFYSLQLISWSLGCILLHVSSTCNVLRAR